MNRTDADGRIARSRDLVVVGGGPAGLATAIYARLHGLSCVVFDRRRLPLDKACGEGLLPRGVDHLREMGVAPEDLRSRPLLGMRFVHGTVIAEGRFPGSPGRGIRRTELIAALAKRARDLGAELHYGTAVDSWTPADTAVQGRAGDHRFTARYLVGADGLHSAVRRAAGLEEPARGRRRFGIRRHFRLQPWSSFYEVHMTDEVDAAIAPVAGDEVGVTMLGPGDGRTFEQLLALFPTLEARLRDAEVVSKARGAGPFRQRVVRQHSGRVALVGDAAGYIDAITGEGLTIGFASARALVRTIADGRSLADYAAAHHRLSSGYDRVTTAVLTIARTPWLRRRAVRTLAEQPDLLDGLLAVNDGDSWRRALGARGTLRILVGLAR